MPKKSKRVKATGKNAKTISQTVNVYLGKRKGGGKSAAPIARPPPVNPMNQMLMMLSSMRRPTDPLVPSTPLMGQLLAPINQRLDAVLVKPQQPQAHQSQQTDPPIHTSPAPPSPPREHVIVPSGMPLLGPASPIVSAGPSHDFGDSNEMKHAAEPEKIEASSSSTEDGVPGSKRQIDWPKFYHPLTFDTLTLRGSSNSEIAKITPSLREMAIHLGIRDNNNKSKAQLTDEIISKLKADGLWKGA